MKRIKDAIAAAVGCALLLSGCAAVPSEGPVTQHSAKTREVDRTIAVVPHGPSDSASAEDLVEGYVQAMSDPSNNFAVAREFLTPDAARSWDPRQGTKVVSILLPAVGSGGSYVVTGSQTASIDARGTHTNTNNATFSHDFKLVRDDRGRWRISNPPADQIVHAYLLSSVMRSVSVYYWARSDPWLVPDRRFVHAGLSGAAEALEMLNRGPAAQLAPGVAEMPAVTFTSSNLDPAAGELSITVARAGSTLTSEQQERLLAQWVWTLRQFGQLKTLKVGWDDGSAWAGGAASGIGLDSFDEFGPDATTGEQLFLIKGGRLARADTSPQGFVPVPVAPAATGGTQGAVEPELSHACVVRGGKTLERVPLGEGAAQPLLDGVEIGRPQYSRTRRVWVPVVGRAELRIWSDRGWQTVTAPGLPAGAVIRAIRLSPDAVRLAMVVATPDGQTSLQLSTVVRNDGRVQLGPASQITLDPDFRPMDVSWSMPAQLTVLGEARGYTQVMKASIDSSDVFFGGPYRLQNLVELAASSDATVVVRSSTGTVYVLDAQGRWDQQATGISGVLYSG